MSGAGYGAAGVAVLFFGSNWVPAKRVRPGDGVFFQFVMASAILAVGLCVQLERGSPQFEPFAMLGGVLWLTGNTLCVPVIQLIGMGLGVLVWGGVNLLGGWMAGKFGFFGTTPDSIKSPALNVVGALICLSSLGAFFFVRPSTPQDKADERALLAAEVGGGAAGEYGTLAAEEEELEGNGDDKGGLMERLGKLPKAQRSLLGFSMAAVAGAFFSFNFLPPQYLIDHHKDAFGRTHSTHALDYVFSHFCGIWSAALLVFLVYAAARGGRPYMPPELVLPAFASGCMWGIAQVAWFVANQELLFVVSFPIVTTGPGLIAAFFGVFLFREIQGRRNFFWLAAAFFLVTTGVAVIAASA